MSKLLNRKLVVALAEDNEAHAYLVEKVFQKKNPSSTLICLLNGQEVISYFRGEGKYQDRELFPMPNLLCLDLRMPLKSGLEVLRELSAEKLLRFTVVVVCSAHAEDQTIKEAYRLGAKSFLQKSSDLDTFATQLEELITFWVGANEFPHPTAAQG
jgi:CheY-like chemotaxis protein